MISLGLDAHEMLGHFLFPPGLGLDAHEMLGHFLFRPGLRLDAHEMPRRLSHFAEAEPDRVNTVLDGPPFP